jgi:hypothetical protein
MGSGADILELAERGYVLAYAKKSGDFNFNVMAFLSVLTFALFAITAYPPLLLPAVAAGCTAYYYYPLKERTPRIGAGQYGIFIDGLGLISWRAVAGIEKVTFTSRLAQTYELQIHLNTPLDDALLTDWRKLPIWRLLMKLPWSLSKDEVIRIPLEPFEPPAREIRSNFIRLWDHFR